jgi:hypothetical protein
VKQFKNIRAVITVKRLKTVRKEKIENVQSTPYGLTIMVGRKTDYIRVLLIKSARL